MIICPPMENVKIQILPERLREQKEKLGFKHDQEMAKFLGISRGYYSQLASGKGEKTGIKKIVDFARRLEVSVGYLTGVQFLIEVINQVCAGEPFHCKDVGQAIEFLDASAIVGFPKQLIKKCYGLRVKDDSMIPTYKKGDIVIVAKDSYREIHHGDKVIYEDRRGDCWIRYVLFTKDSLMIKSLEYNPETMILPLQDLKKLSKIITAQAF